jgi:hypothetical protein
LSIIDPWLPRHLVLETPRANLVLATSIKASANRQKSSVSVPDIVAGANLAGFADGIECVGVSAADLAGFLDDFEGGEVVDPAELIW